MTRTTSPDWTRWERMNNPYWGTFIYAYQYRDTRTGRIFQFWRSDAGGPSSVVEIDVHGNRLNAPDPNSKDSRERGVIFAVPRGENWLTAVERYIAEEERKR